MKRTHKVRLTDDESLAKLFDLLFGKFSLHAFRAMHYGLLIEFPLGLQIYKLLTGISIRRNSRFD